MAAAGLAAALSAHGAQSVSFEVPAIREIAVIGDPVRVLSPDLSGIMSGDSQVLPLSVADLMPLPGPVMARYAGAVAELAPHGPLIVAHARETRADRGRLLLLSQSPPGEGAAAFMISLRENQPAEHGAALPARILLAGIASQLRKPLRQGDLRAANGLFQKAFDAQCVPAAAEWILGWQFPMAGPEQAPELRARLLPALRRIIPRRVRSERRREAVDLIAGRVEQRTDAGRPWALDFIDAFLWLTDWGLSDLDARFLGAAILAERAFTEADLGLWVAPEPFSSLQGALLMEEYLLVSLYDGRRRSRRSGRR